MEYDKTTGENRISIISHDGAQIMSVYDEDGYMCVQITDETLDEEWIPVTMLTKAEAVAVAHFLLTWAEGI